MTDPCYAVFVMDGAKVSDDLVGAGFECWHFTYKRFRPGAQWQLRNVNGRMRVASRAHSEIRSPMFEGYVFARIPPDRFAEVLNNPRVIDVVRGAGDEPRPVPKNTIDEAIRAVLSCEWDEETAPAPKTFNLDKPLKAVVVKNRARARGKRRKGAAKRIRKWLAEGKPQHLAKAA